MARSDPETCYAIAEEIRGDDPLPSVYASVANGWGEEPRHARSRLSSRDAEVAGEAVVALRRCFSGRRLRLVERGSLVLRWRELEVDFPGSSWSELRAEYTDCLRFFTRAEENISSVLVLHVVNLGKMRRV